MLLPERMFNGAWHRILHDQTAEAMAREIQRLPHANVTTVPFHFDEEHEHARRSPEGEVRRAVTRVTRSAQRIRPGNRTGASTSLDQ